MFAAQQFKQKKKKRMPEEANRQYDVKGTVHYKIFLVVVGEEQKKMNPEKNE